MTPLTFSQKRYLASLYTLQLTMNEVRAVHIARHLGVTAASTSVALHALCGKGLLCVSGTGRCASPRPDSGWRRRFARVTSVWLPR